VSKGEADIADGECDSGAGSRGARAEAVDQRADEGRGHDRDSVDRADDEPGDAQAEPAAVLQVDDLEREHGAVSEVVQEDPELDEPELPRQTEAKAARSVRAHGTASNFVIVHKDD
jgi:hypothetical protein